MHGIWMGSQSKEVKRAISFEKLSFNSGEI